MRAIGSGNIGATNVLRTGRKDIAAATLLLDGLKGTAAVLIMARFAPEAGAVAGFAAFLGHIFPVWLKFKGGKGVATFFGCLFGFAWPAGLAFMRDLALGRLSFAHFLALGACRQRRVAHRAMASGASRRRRAGRGHDRDPVAQAQGQYRPAARRDRRQDRPEEMKARRLGDEEKLDWLQLIRCENIGPRTFRALIQRYGDAGAALRALPDLIRQSKGRPVTLASRESALREWELAQKFGARFIALPEPDYPPGLRAIDSAPPLIAVRGDAEFLRKPMVALVGSRNASAAGLAMTERLALGLGAAGYAVVSGLARGIDGAAHKASLATGAVGVLAGGLDRPYPPENLALAGANGRARRGDRGNAVRL